MALKLYSTAASVGCRAVLLVATELGAPLEVVPMNLRGGDQFKPEFLALNPQHCVPTLQHGEFVLWESRTICRYLASWYKSTTLYPTDLQQRARVDLMLDFDIGTLHPIFSKSYRSVIEGIQDAPFPEDLRKLDEALGFLEKFLSTTPYVAGKHLTVADCCLVATVSTCEVVNHDLKKFSKILSWLERCKETLKGYEMHNVPGLRLISAYASAKRAEKNKK